jgi:hypothetical protein
MAMASCVKLLAVPGPPPGPCEAKAALAANKPAAVDEVTNATRDIRCIRRNHAMTISCDDQVAEDTDENVFRV